MDKDKIQLLEESLQQERLALKKAEAILKQKSLDLDNTNKELQAAKHSLSIVEYEKQIELDNLFKSIIDPYVLMDLMGNVVKMNQASSDFFGIENLDKPFNVMTILHREDVGYAMNAFRQFVKDGSFRNFQARLFNRQKELKWVDINCNIIYNKEGKAKLAQGIIRDITKQKQQQHIFDEQKKQLNAIVEYSSLGIILTRKRKIIKCNRAIQDLLSYSEEELLSMDVTDICIREDKDRSQELMKKLEIGELDHFALNKRYRTKKGRVIWAKTNVSVVRTRKKDPDYEVFLIEDVTKELQNQSLLKALNGLMSSILGKTNIYEIAWEITSNASELLGLENCVIYLMNYKSGKLKQIAFYSRYPEEREVQNHLPEVEVGVGLIGHVAKTGSSEIVNNISLDKRLFADDKIRMSEISVPIIANNEIIGVIDSTNPKKDFFSDYHLKTLETIANLAATQLKSALNLQLRIETDKKNKILVKNLTQSNKELKDFAHVVSHDLKSPLRSMNALVSWIQEEMCESTNEIIDQNIQLLLKKIDKMDHLINGILKYASIDQVDSLRRKIDLDIVVKELIETIYVPEHITLSILNKLPELHIDKFRVHQLFQNLISNAITYMDKEKGIINIDCKEEENNWVFSVEDNGMGISDKYHQKIFEIFQTLENNDASTGVGLSIVKKIIDIYDGKIWLSSALDKGTTFYFSLPK